MHKSWMPSLKTPVPVAVQACLLVIEPTPCEVRRQAAQTLYAVVQDRPGRQVPKMLSQGEYLRCYACLTPMLSGPRGVPGRAQAGTASLEGEHATATLKELWETMIGHQQDQTGVVSSYKLYAFPQQGDPAPLLEAVAKESGESETEGLQDATGHP